MKKDKLSNRILFLSPTVQAGWQPQSHITDFKLQQKLGSGSFGTVYKAIHKKTSKIYAIKQIKKIALNSQKLLQHAKCQVRIMYELNHPNIIKLYNHFEDELSIFLILEYASHGQLYNLLKQQPDRYFVQSVASNYIRQITLGLKQIHSKNIMHRDLKLQNILVDQNYNMKIADFGWSHFVEQQQKRNTYCGTLDYLAPQMIEKGHQHDEKVDIWSIGVLVYELATGYSPFSCTLSGSQISIENVKKNIKSVSYKFPNSLSQECQDLIRSILKKNPQQRLSLAKILVHPWITMHNKINTNNSNDIKNIDEIQKQDFMQKIASQMKQMFPQNTITNVNLNINTNTNNSNNNNNINANVNVGNEKSINKNYFTNQQIYKYSRPDSIINLKPKKKQIGGSPAQQQKVPAFLVSSNASSSTSSKTQITNSPLSSSLASMTPTNQNMLSTNPNSNPNTNTFHSKKLSELQLRILTLQKTHKSDQQQIQKLKQQLIQSKDHKNCRAQIKQLMDQIINQNKIMEQINNKLVESQKRVMILQKQKGYNGQK